jgi:integrase
MPSDTTKQVTSPALMLTDAKVASFKPPPSGRIEYRDLKTTGLRLRVGSGGKTWIVRARGGGKTVNKKLGTYPAMGLGTARSAAHNLLSLIALTGDADAGDRTFGTVAELWLEKAKEKNKGWRLQQRRLELHVLPKWGNRRITSIRRGEVRELIEGLEGKALPNGVLGVIRPVFRYALVRDWIEGSPAEGIERPYPYIARDRVLSMTEIGRVWRATEMLGFPYRQYIRTLILSAQRRGEVAAMRWDGVDLDAASWTIESSATKSRRAHLVPLDSDTRSILRNVPKISAASGAPEFVFTTDGDTHISCYADIKRKLDTFIAADGSGPMKPWVLHDLRRTAATHMVRLGVLEEVVGKVLNHAVQGVTAKVYALHRYEPEKREALERWAREVAAHLARSKTGGEEP